MTPGNEINAGKKGDAAQIASAWIEATMRLRRPTPIESLQHPLSVYQALLQEARA